MTNEAALLRAWSAELAATELYLRVTACGHLTHAASIRVERRANAHAARLLQALGLPDVETPVEPPEIPFVPGLIGRARDEETDELLSAAVKAPSGKGKGRGRKTGRAGSAESDATAAEPVALEDVPTVAMVAFDEGTEHTAELPSDEHTPPSVETPRAAPSAPAAAGAWVTYEEVSAQELKDFDEDHRTDEVVLRSTPDSIPPTQRAEEQSRPADLETPADLDLGALVSFEDESPTNPGIEPLEQSRPASIGPAGEVAVEPAAEKPAIRPQAETPGNHSQYLAYDAPEAEEEEEITGIFEGKKKSPPLAAPTEVQGDEYVTLDSEPGLEPVLADDVEVMLEDDENTGPMPQRPSVPARLQREPEPARARNALEGEEFELVVAEEEEDDTAVRIGIPSPGFRPIAESVEDIADGASDSEVVESGAAKGKGKAAVALPRAAAAPRVAVTPAPPPIRAGAASAATAKVTAGLYGNRTLPTIRDTADPKPRAAAIQINAQQGTSKVLGLEEEEEPLEIGSAEDYGEEEPEWDPSQQGLRVDIQEYEEVEPEPAEEEPEPPTSQAPAAVPQREIPAGPTRSDILQMMNAARAADEAGQLDEGIALYSDVLDADPDSVEARIGRGRLYLDRGDFARAMSDFMVAEEGAPENPEPQIAIGDLHFARKDYRKAIDYFDLAITLAPASAKAYCRRGISHYYRKNYPQALKDLAQAQKIDPNTANIATYVSMVKKKMKK